MCKMKVIFMDSALWYHLCRGKVAVTQVIIMLYLSMLFVCISMQKYGHICH